MKDEMPPRPSTFRKIEVDTITDPDLQQLNQVNQIFLSTDKESHAPMLAYLNARYGEQNVN